MDFEKNLRTDLQQYLLAEKCIDKKAPVCTDVEEYWNKIAEEYMADGIREFNSYPTVSLGWMMFIGMAMAKYWDADWSQYSQSSNLYADIRDKRGYDNMDDYILQEVLCLDKAQAEAIGRIVGECAQRSYSMLCHSRIAAGTPEAFKAYVACLHQLYLMGMSMQLKNMDYHMSLT